MADYICRQDVEDICHHYGATIGIHSGIADVIGCQVGKLPAADVQEVKRGHIVEKKRHRSRSFEVECYNDSLVRRQGLCKGPCHTFESYDYYEHYCSECGKILGDYENFCGNCGASMEEK